MQNKNSYKHLPDEKGYFGDFGGRYVSETLMPLILEVDKEYNKIIKPIDNEEIFIGGESFSKKQGWIEGSLETCHDIIKSMKIKGYNVEEKI